MIVFTLRIDFSICSQMERVDIQSIFWQYFTVKYWVKVDGTQFSSVEWSGLEGKIRPAYK